MPDRENEISCDVLVVGTGAGALTAAIAAHDAGAQVLIVEKSDQYGGTSATSGGGIWIPNNHHLFEEGGDDSLDDARAYMAVMVGNAVSSDRIDAYLDQAPRMVRYLEDHTQARFAAMPYPDYFPEQKGGKRGYRTLEPLPTHAKILGAEFANLRPPHKQVTVLGRICITMKEGRAMLTQAKGSMLLAVKLMLKYWLDISGRLQGRRDRRLTMGGALVARLRASLLDRKVPLLLSSPLTELVYDQDRVIGAVIEQDGQKKTITVRKGVILGAGGFEHNQALREKFLPKPSSRNWTAGNVHNTGDTLVAAMDIGAKTDLMDSAWWAPSIKVPGDDRAYILFAERSLPGNVIVNKAGERFANEAFPYLESGYAMYQADSIPSFCVFDATFRHKYPFGPLMPASVQSDDKLPSRICDLLFKADSIEELAERMGVDAAGLRKTIEKNNQYAATGRDPDYARGDSFYDQYYGDSHSGKNPCIAAIEKAPFYGIEVFPGDIGTKGGLLTDATARVLAEDGSVIEGLYAIGNTSSSVMGRSYPGAGSTIGPAMTFGFIAGHHAAGS